jgi:GH15 family glucan-1,4-alpha-glucosidase
VDHPQIGDYALVGDCRSAALVSRAGAVDWLAWPGFESPSLFAAVLDAHRGGSFSITPTGAFSARRAYVDETNVLVTELRTPEGGTARLTDVMSVWSEEDKHHMPVPEHELLRLVEGTAGELELEVRFEPRPDYARAPAALHDAGALGLRFPLGRGLATLRTDAGPRMSGTRLRLRAGDAVVFSLTYDTEAPAVLPPLEGARERIERAIRWWQAWARPARIYGPRRALVVRSALALKLLSFAPSGAILAAPTTSLPERIGGALNWDYRFCWLRDAAFTIRALAALGFVAEGESFVAWLLHTTKLTRPRLRNLYDVYGNHPGRERLLHHLDGYRGSRPVRVRNAAVDQLQLDVYGEVIDAVTQLARRSPDRRLDLDTQALLVEFGNNVCEGWWLGDQGIWEPRTKGEPHTHSRLLAWTALDRLIELHGRGKLRRAPIDRLRRERARIERDLDRRAWNPDIGAYTQVLGGDTVDSTAILMSWYGFHDARDPRMRNTYELLRARLGAGPGLVYRYEQSRTEAEGAFVAASMWMVEFLARGGGTLAEAERAFDAVVARAVNDVGLMAEEVDPETGEALGNFPQAFSHVGLIGAALSIEQRAREEQP